MIPALIVPLLLSVPAACASAARAQSPALPEFRPEPGLVLLKEYTFEHSLVLLEMSFTDANGAQNSQAGMDLHSTFRWNARDRYRAFANGRTTLLEREFPPSPFLVEVGTPRQDGGKEPHVLDGGTPLAGSIVRFTWVEEEAAYGRLYTRREGPEEYLESLEEASDCVALLPPAGTRADEPWTIEPARLASVVAPGGRLPLRFGRGAENLFSRAVLSGIGGPLAEIVKGRWSGTVKARLSGPGRIALEVDVSVESDLGAFTAANMSPLERLRGDRVVSSRSTWSFKGTGELVWNDATRTARSLALSGSETIGSEIVFGSAASTSTSTSTSNTKSVLRWKGGLKIAADFLTPEMAAARDDKAAQPR